LQRVHIGPSEFGISEIVLLFSSKKKCPVVAWCFACTVVVLAIERLGVLLLVDEQYKAHMRFAQGQVINTRVCGLRPPFGHAFTQ